MASLTAWPRNDGRLWPLALSVGDEPRLGELPGDASDLHDRKTCSVGEDDGHLQDDLQLVSDVVGGELSERLGALTGLEHECLTVARPSPANCVNRRASPANTKGGSFRSSSSAPFELGRVRPLRLLRRRTVVPRLRASMSRS